MIKNKWLLPLLSVLMLGTGIAKAASIGVLASPGTAAAGSTVNLSVRANTVQDLAGVQFTLTSFQQSGPSNPPPISFANTTGIVVGPFLDGAHLEANPDGPNLKIALARNQGASGTGVLLTVPVHIPEGAVNGTVYEFKIIDVTAGDSNGQPLQLSNGGEALVHVFTPNPSQASVKLGQAAGPAGGTATLVVTAASLLHGAQSLAFTLHFDPSLTVSPSDVSLGSLLTGTPQVDASLPGQLKFSITNPNLINGPGALLTVSFHIPSNAPVGTAYPVAVSDLMVLNAQGTSIPSQFASSGLILVTGTPTTPGTIDGGIIRVKSIQIGAKGFAYITVEVNDKVTHLNGASFRLVLSSKTPANAPDPVPSGNALHGSLLPGATLAVQPLSGEGINVGLASAHTSDGPGSLVVIPLRFNTPPQVNTVYSFGLEKVVLSIDGVDKTCAAEGGTVSIVPNAKGDVDGNGAVNTNDAVMTLMIVIGAFNIEGRPEGFPSASQLFAADANSDGVVTISDVVKILKVIVGLDTLDSFPPLRQ
jgi:hypothetical protein